MATISAQKKPTTNTTTTNTTNTTDVNITFNERSTNRNQSIYNGKKYFEQLVINEIMEGYDARTLPFNIHPDPKIKTTYNPIKIQLELFGINKVEFVNGRASFIGAFREEWTDVSLQWDPKDFGGVSSVKMPTNPETDGRVWVPDFVIREDVGK